MLFLCSERDFFANFGKHLRGDAEERGEVLQGKMLNNTGTALQQQLIAFAGEFAGDYPNCLFGRPAQTTIEAMMPSRIFRVSGEQLLQWFRENGETMELRAIVAEHLLFQARRSYLDFHRTTARERYELLLRRCPGIVHHLALQDLASFLCVTPNYLSSIRKDITFEAKK